MANKHEQRDVLTTLIAKAMRENTDPYLSPWDVAVVAANKTGLRRAIWHALTPKGKERMVAAAAKKVREE